MLNSSSNFKNLEITNEPFPPQFDVPESYNQLNTILSFYNLPLIDQNDDLQSKLDKLNILCKNKSLEQINKEALNSIKERISEVNHLKEMEQLCDAWEVELANLNSESSRRFSNLSIEELKNILEEMKSNLNLNRKFEQYREILDGIVKMDNKALLSLGYLKEDSFGYYAKQKVIEKLESKGDEWATVLCRIVKENSCKVEVLRNELGIERVNLLRIIYSYSSKGILEYDRINDTVRIVDN